MRRELGILMALSLALCVVACSQSHGGLGGETHWLTCESDSDCDTGQRCSEDGVCVDDGAAADTAPVDGGAEAQALATVEAAVADAESCPAEPPISGDPCGLPEGQICGFRYADPDFASQEVYSECACRAGCAEAGVELRWDCFNNVVSALMNCPARPPEDGSDCFGLKGHQCQYPGGLECTCPTDEGDDRWRCESAFGGPEVSDPPADVDGARKVAELDDDGRAAFCEWLTAVPPGFPAPVELPITDDGFYPATGCAYTGATLGCPGVAMPLDLPASACIANLERSGCQATLDALIDCVVSLQTGHPASRGCAPVLSAEGCEDTIVLADEGIGGIGAFTACPLPVR